MQDHDVAIIGMGCRFPDADNPSEFFDNLKNGRCSIRKYTVDELLESGVDPALCGQSNYRTFGATISQISDFDNEFFGLTPKEAKLLDPQHRVMMELAVHTMEDAGIVQKSGIDIGLFGSVSASSYFLNQLVPAAQNDQCDFTMEEAYSGSRTSFAISRVAYHLGLTGPVMLIDTACSSSLVAVHEAVQAIRNGECGMALAGGVSIQVPVKSGYLYSKDGIMSEDGICRAFDTQATGSVRGNGGGMILLKPLRQAIQDNDKVYGVVCGSAVNNDGNERVGFTAPSAKGQADSFVRAMDDAKIFAHQLSYYEGHGSGTRLGDEIELKAVHRALEETNAESSPRRKPLKIGSVKTNIGHLDSTAGIAGLIKTLLVLERKTLLPSLNFNKPNTTLKIFSDSIQVQTKAENIDLQDGQYATVASLGIGGTNAHIVLKGYRKSAAVVKESPPEVYWLPITAKSEIALVCQVKQMLVELQGYSAAKLFSAIKTLFDRRTHYAFRVVFSGESLSELAIQMQSYIENMGLAHNSAFGEMEVPLPLQAWLDGKAISFSQIYECPGDIDWFRLPGYRFVKKYFWVSENTFDKNVDISLPKKSVELQTIESSQKPKDVASVETIWEKAFGFSPINNNKNFFELGGHSLLATQIIALMNDEYGLSLGLKDFFANPTILEQVKFVENAKPDQGEDVREEDYNKVPLTPMQMELWYQHMRTPLSNTFNLVAAEKIHGPIELAHLYQATVSVIERYPILRACYRLHNNQVCQESTDIVNQAVYYQDKAIEWVGLDDQSLDLAISDCIDEFGNRAFDLQVGALFEACIVRITREEHMLILRQHRIVSDAQTLGTIFKDIVEGYVEYTQGSEGFTKSVDYGYYDYCYQLKRNLNDHALSSPIARRLQAERVFWQENLQSPFCTLLPTNTKRDSELSDVGRSVRFKLGEEITPQVKQYCQTQKISIFSFLLATFKFALHRFSQQSDIIVVTPALNRDQACFHTTAGHFMNRVAIRSQLVTNASIGENLKAIHLNSVKALEHQTLPFESMLEATGLLGRYRNEPLMQTVFMLQDTEQDEALSLPGVSLTSLYVPFNRSRYDLTGVMRLENGVFHGRIDCKAELLDKKTLNQFMNAWVQLIEQTLQDANLSLQNLRVHPKDLGNMQLMDCKEDMDQEFLTENLRPFLGYWQMALGRYLSEDMVDNVQSPDFWSMGGTIQQLVLLHHQIEADFPNTCFKQLANHLGLRAYVDYLSTISTESAVAAEKSVAALESDRGLVDHSLLSAFQKRLWFLQQYHSSSSTYNLPAAFLIQNEIDPKRLYRSIKATQKQFYLLNCSLQVTDDEPFWSLTDTPVTWQVNDLSDLAIARQDASLDVVSQKMLNTPFDLNDPNFAPLWRGAWVKLSPNSGVLLLCFHHLLADQVSGSLFMQALLECYKNSALTDDENFIANTKNDFPAYVLSQNTWLNTAQAKHYKRFWNEYLRPCNDLQLAVTTRTTEFTTQQRFLSLTEKQTASLHNISQRLSVSLSTVLQSIYGILIYRFIGIDCFCIGVPVSLHERGWQHCFGPLLNTLPVKFDAKPFYTFIQQVLACHENILAAISHKDLPLEEIIDTVEAPRTTDLPPLFQTLFSYLEAQPLSGDSVQLDITPIPMPAESSDYPITLEAIKNKEGLELRLSLSDEHFSQACQDQMIDNLDRLISECIENSDLSVQQYLMPIIGDIETGKTISLFDKFTSCVNEHPNKLAIVGEGIRLSYRDVSNQIAFIQTKLTALGLIKGQGVAILMESRSSISELLMACLFSGFYFVPIDSRWGEKRIQYVLKDANVTALITNIMETVNASPELITISFDTLVNGSPSASSTSLECRASASDLAYIMYTSGSTGHPKGVAISQISLSAYCHYMPKQIAPSPQHRVLALTAISFDIMITELILPLTTSSTIALYNESLLPDSIANFLREYHVNYIQTTPSIWQLILGASSFSPLLGTKALAGGEPLPTALAKDLIHKGVELYNVYGPTEATVWCSYKHIDEELIEKSNHIIRNIGKPFKNTQVLILDSNRKPLSKGAVGELALKGTNLSDGYWNQPTLTTKSFIHSDLISSTSKGSSTRQKLYCTGDRVRWLNDELYFLGRDDKQIKLNGQRIELDEIDHFISDIDGIDGVYTTLVEFETNTFIACYVCSEAITEKEIRQNLIQALPYHYIPSLISVNRTPILSINGKWDLNKMKGHLVEVLITHTLENSFNDSGLNHSWQQDPTTVLVLRVMEETLGLAHLDINDNFFNRGGHSLLAVKLINSLSQQLGLQLPLSSVFEHPTPALLAELINTFSVYETVYQPNEAYEEGEV